MGLTTFFADLGPLLCAPLQTETSGSLQGRSDLATRSPCPGYDVRPTSEEGRDLLRNVICSWGVGATGQAEACQGRGLRLAGCGMTFHALRRLVGCFWEGLDLAFTAQGAFGLARACQYDCLSSRLSALCSCAG